LTEITINLPVSEKDVRKLKVGDHVYVNGIVHTMRDMGHRRVVELTKKGEKLPFNLKEGAIWHCGPIVKKKNRDWKIMSAGPTSSSRFTELGARIVKEHQVRLTIGKGNMGEPMVNALKETGGVYLLATGGCAALYAKNILKVDSVHWLDLGMPEATWILSVNRLGPLIVGIDSEGNSLAQIVRTKLRAKIKDIYKNENINPKRTYVWWPKKVAGTKEATETLDS
jgi:fumarate hydratase subunit beta